MQQHTALFVVDPGVGHTKGNLYCGIFHQIAEAGHAHAKAEADIALGLSEEYMDY